MKKYLALAVLLLTTFVTGVAHSQAATATLRAQSTSPSLGFGQTSVLFAGPKLSVDIYFGQLDGKSKSAYILCCGTNIAQAKPATSNLIDTVSGYMQGTFVADLDTDSAAFWDSVFLGGGTPADARTKLIAALGSQQAYFVVTSDIYPDVPFGEISATFLVPTKPISMRTVPGEPYGVKLIQPGDKVGALTTTGNPYVCTGLSDRCVVPVYVSSQTDTTGITTCEARVDTGVIRVPKPGDGRTIRVIWLLIEGNVGDTASYRFKDVGIDITGNNPKVDFNGKGMETADGKRFKWLRVTTTSATTGLLSYNAWVERLDPSTGSTIPCKPADPMIANTN